MEVDVGKRALGLLLAMLWVEASGSAYAEEVPSPVVGSKVRVYTGAQLERLTATIVGVEPDGLRLQVKGEWDARALRWEEMRRLDISLGRSRRSGAKIGALAGVAVAGGTTLWLRSATVNGDWSCGGACPVLVWAVLSVPAAVVGAGLGALAAPERWRHVQGVSGSAPLMRTGIEIVPMRGGLGVGVRYAF